MKRDNSRRLGFTLVELMVVILVFSIVAYGIFNFFKSQSTNTLLQSATSQVNREGQVVTNFMRQELLGAKDWFPTCDRTVATFKNVHGDTIIYSFDPDRKVLTRKVNDTSPVDMAPNVETVEFHYYLSGFNETDENNTTGNEYELSTPVLDCDPESTEPCPVGIKNIRIVEVKMVLTSASQVYQPGSRQSLIASKNPLTGTDPDDGRVRRLFMVRALSRNLLQVANDSSVESGCGTVTLSAATNDMISCDADGPVPNTITAITKVPVAGSLVVTNEGSVKISAIYRPNNSPAPESWCADVTCAIRDPGGLPPDDPQLDADEITAAMRESSQGVGLTSPADQYGNKILVAASWLPPATVACENPPIVHSSTPITITIVPGAIYSMLSSGTAVRSSDTLGSVSAAALYSCGVSGGCTGNSGLVKIQLLDKCNNPIKNLPVDGVKFSIATGFEAYGSFDGASDIDYIVMTTATNGVYTAQVFTANMAPSGGVIPINVEVVETPTINAQISVPVRACDLPKELVVVTPSSLQLPDTTQYPIKACPGHTDSIYVEVRNACGDAITATSSSTTSPTNPANWAVTLDSALADDAEARQIGTLGPVSGGVVVPQSSGSSFKIDYMTGGTGLDASTITTAYCGVAQSNVPINIWFTPLSETDGKKTVALTLEKCPPLSVALDIPTPNPETGLAVTSCTGPSGPGSEDLCMEVGSPTPTITSDDMFIRATVTSCETEVVDGVTQGISLKNTGVLFKVTNPNDPTQYPSFAEAANPDQNFLAVFPSTFTGTVGDQIAHLNSGIMTVIGPTPLPSKLNVTATVCFPGNNGVLDTTFVDSTCAGDDQSYPTNPLDAYEDFWAGPSKAGFMNKTSTGENFVKGRVGFFNSNAFDVASQLWPETLSNDYPYGPVLEMPTATEDREIYFEVRDGDENQQTGSIDTITLLIRPTYSSTWESEMVMLTETGANTGIFRSETPLAITLYQGILHAGKLDVVAGDLVRAMYTDNDDVSDAITSRFYMTGCRSIAAKSATGTTISMVSPSMVAADNIDSSTNTDVMQRHAFHLELIMPEKAYYTGNTTEGETLLLGMHTGMTDLYSPNSEETFTLVESSFSGGTDNSGRFHIDPSIYSSQSYIYVSEDPSNTTPCADPNSEVCFALDDSPSLIEIGYDAESPSSVVSPDCSVMVSVADIDRPRVSLDKVSMGGFSGSALSDGARVSGTIYMSGIANDGNGSIAVDGVTVSGDAGISYVFPGVYNAIANTWQLSVDTSIAPDGIYTLQVRAEDSAGNYGYSTDTPLSGIGSITIIIDNVSDNIDLYDYYYDVCGDHTFTVDASGFIPWPDTSKTVSFYLGSDPTPLATVPVDSSGLAQVTFNVDAWTALDEEYILLRAEVSDNNTPQTVLFDYGSFHINKTAMNINYTTTYSSTPLEGIMDATIIVSSCRGVATVEAQTYLMSNPLLRSGFISGIQHTCLVTAPDGICKESLWHVNINTTPTDCQASSGYSPDGENALHIKAVDNSGNTGYSDTVCINNGWPTITCEPGFAVDNIPVVNKTLPVSSMVSGSADLQMRVEDCDGVPNGGVSASVITPLGVTLPPIDLPYQSGTAQNGLFGLTVNTNDFPACATYWRDGLYTYTIIADDNAPAVTCSSMGLNRCGIYSGNVTVINPPANVAITQVNGAAPVDGSTKSGTITIQARADDCDFQAGRGSVKLYIDGVEKSAFTLSGTPGIFNYPSPGFDTKTLTMGSATYVFTVVANDGNGNIVTSAGITFTIDNRPACTVLTPMTITGPTNVGGSGTNTRWQIVVSGYVQDASTHVGVVGQDVTVNDTTNGGGSKPATTTTGGAFNVTYVYIQKNAPTSFSYAVNLVLPDICGSCTNVPYPVTVTKP